jgi:hypothetical protein
MRAADIMSDCPNLCKDGSTELKKQKIGATDLLQIQQILPFPCLEKLQSPQWKVKGCNSCLQLRNCTDEQNILEVQWIDCQNRSKERSYLIWHTWASNRTRNWSCSLLSSSMIPFAVKLISLEGNDPKVIGDSLKLFPADQLQLLFRFGRGGIHRHLTEYAPIDFQTISNSRKAFRTSIMISLGSAWDCKRECKL